MLLQSCELDVKMYLYFPMKRMKQNNQNCVSNFGLDLAAELTVLCTHLPKIWFYISQLVASLLFLRKAVQYTVWLIESQTYCLSPQRSQRMGRGYFTSSFWLTSVTFTCTWVCIKSIKQSIITYAPMKRTINYENTKYMYMYHQAKAKLCTGMPFFSHQLVGWLFWF
mgnify:CR=1 FL=1